ncbi:hypothetical protein EON83_29255 [bacterium]|nr:MAG: hypothetical protein EON83_29255 [bacterium]
MKIPKLPLGFAFLCATLSTFPLAVQAAPGDLDTTFGTGGIVATDAPTDVTDIALQSDGKIVSAGGVSGNFSVSRYNTNGTLDTSFGSGGTVLTDFGGGSSDKAFGVVIQSNGKILVAGYSNAPGVTSFAVARYNSNGTLDTTFSGDGLATTQIGTTSSIAYDLALQSDGKIVVVGTSNNNFAILRYNSNGTLDTSFSGDGIDVRDAGRNGQDIAKGVAIQSDGKIVVGGDDALFSGSTYTQRFVLMRYNTNGTLDTGFSGDGIQTTNFGPGVSGNPIKDGLNGIAIQSDGKIVAAGFTKPGTTVAGSTVQSIAIARYTTSGALDTSFSSDGLVETVFPSGQSQASDVAIQSNGKIVVVGYNQDAGSTYSAVARYNTNGSLDTSFSGDGLARTALNTSLSYGYANSVAIQSDGKIVGGASTYLVRYIGDTIAAIAPATAPSGNAS